MAVYSVEKLMEQTRQLAANYYLTTQQILPVSSELARFDACRLLGLEAAEFPMSGVDALAVSGEQVQIKARVILKEGKAGSRVGQINSEGDWDLVLLVLMNSNYETTEIFEANRDEIFEGLEDNNPARAKRGAMSVAKFKALGRLVWNKDQGLLA